MQVAVDLPNDFMSMKEPGRCRARVTFVLRSETV